MPDASTQTSNTIIDGNASGPARPGPIGRGRGALRETLAWLLALAVFCVYTVTGAPGAWWGDGQELACAAWTLGIPHPTGYPLYMLTGHAAMKMMRWLDPGRALTVYSALLLAAAIGALIPFFRRVIIEERETTEGGACGRGCGMAELLPAVGVGLLIAFARTIWDHGTFAEVYPLTFFVGALALRLAWAPAEARPGAGRAAALGAVMGLGMLNHYSLLALGPLAALAIVQWTVRAERRRWLIPLAALACFCLMLTGYLYLPLRAAANPPLNWGDPVNWERIKWVLSGAQYQDRFMKNTAESMATGVMAWVAWWGRQWLPAAAAGSWVALPAGMLLIIAALGGLARLTLRRWEAGLGLLGAMAATMTFGALYHIPDIAAYFMIALPAAAVGWIVAARWLAARAGAKIRHGMGRLLRATPALAAATLALTNAREMDKSWDNMPALYGQAVLNAAPQGALIVCSNNDNDIYSLWYQQIVLGKRPDVTVFGAQFMTQGWYGRYFERADRPKVPIHVEDRGGRPFENEVPYNLRLFGKVLLPNLAQGRPVLVTYREPFLSEYLNPQPVATLLPSGYRDICAYPSAYLPYPALSKLQDNPGLRKLDADAMEREFQGFLNLLIEKARSNGM